MVQSPARGKRSTTAGVEKIGRRENKNEGRRVGKQENGDVCKITIITKLHFRLESCKPPIFKNNSF